MKVIVDSNCCVVKDNSQWLTEHACWENLWTLWIILIRYCWGACNSVYLIGSPVSSIDSNSLKCFIYFPSTNKVTNGPLFHFHICCLIKAYHNQFISIIYLPISLQWQVLWG